MRKWLLLLPLAALMWWFWPVSAPDDPVRERAFVAELRQRLQARPLVVPRLSELEEVSFAETVPVEAEEVEEDPLEEGWGRLMVDVVNEDGRTDNDAEIKVSGCMNRGEGRGGWLVYEGTPCTVWARRQDGALSTHATEQIVVPAGDTVYLELELHQAKRGGLGVGFRHVGKAVKVLHVVPGTPAAAEGLERGDLILEVDGVPVSELSAEEFVQTLTGPEGTEVDFVLGFEDEERWVEEEVLITRQAFGS